VLLDKAEHPQHYRHSLNTYDHQFTPQLSHLALCHTSWAVVSPPTTAIRLASSRSVWCLQRPQVMLNFNR